MAEVKWIKIATEMFDNRKIRQIENLPDGDSIIVIWMKLLCLAGDVNDNGLVYFTKDIPYTEQMLASQFSRPLATVQAALHIFEKFDMIEIVNDILQVSNWAKYQNADKMAEIREYNRIAQQRYRAQLKAAEKSGKEQTVNDNVNDKSMTSQKEKEKNQKKEKPDLDIDIDLENKSIVINDNTSSAPESPTCQFEKIKELYHSLCPSFPRIREIAGQRRKAVAARWRQYQRLTVFEEMFRAAESSSFLKGNNGRNWHADFDWMMNATNFSKILERKYDEKGSRAAGGNRFVSVLDEMGITEEDYQRQLQERGGTG